MYPLFKLKIADGVGFATIRVIGAHLLVLVMTRVIIEVLYDTFIMT